MAPDDRATAGARGAWRGWLALAIGLAPALAAVWRVPWFVTQDGPAHLYNARIIAASFDPHSPFGDYFQVRWQLLPNWAGHIVTALLLAVLPAREADRVLMTLTLAGFAGAIVWFRARVAGERGLWFVALAASLLGLNLTWLFGFTSFLLGACLFPITLGVWWAGREHLGWRRVAGLSTLLVLGYFCHLVSLGLTAIGLFVLALWTPSRNRGARMLRTAAALAPLVPLGLVYLSYSRQGGRMHPVWEHLSRPFALASWMRQLTAIDPITLASKSMIPLAGTDARWFGLLAPPLWLALGLCLVACAVLLAGDPAARERRRERRGWTALALLLLAGGTLGPDSLGPTHGDFLPQRLILFGLAALLPALDLEAVFGTPEPARRESRWAARLAAGGLAAALAVQSAVVWDYALTSRDRVGGFVQARKAIGRGERVATLLNHFRGRFRVNPLLHADCLIGLETDSIIWSDYETRYYYFPVQFREGLDRPLSRDLELMSITSDEPNTAERASDWEHLLEAHHDAIDALLVWGDDPHLDPITGRWFETAFREGKTRVLKPRGTPRTDGRPAVTPSPASGETASSRSPAP